MYGGGRLEGQTEWLKWTIRKFLPKRDIIIRAFKEDIILVFTIAYSSLKSVVVAVVVE